jgi:hypothetical protein
MYARAAGSGTDWCRKHRHLPIPQQHTQLVAKMQGHYAYYGISGNFRRPCGARPCKGWLGPFGGLSTLTGLCRPAFVAANHFGGELEAVATRRSAAALAYHTAAFFFFVNEGSNRVPL